MSSNNGPRVFSTKEPPSREELEALYAAIKLLFHDDEAMLMCLAMLVPVALFNHDASKAGAAQYCEMIVDVYGKMLGDITQLEESVTRGSDEVLH
jgi:hypothetical protein